jgi:pimeloyl-ACP methyl ester carboxylesterase
MSSMRFFLCVLAAGVLALPAAASAATCPVSHRSNGTGYRPAPNVQSLPPVGTGPDILHSAPPTSPQLENSGYWNAPPILISGTTAYRDGEFLYQDFLYDDRALTYPDDRQRLAGNAADFVEVRLKPLKSATAIRITLNSMLGPNAAAVTIGLGGGAQAQPMPHNAGAKMPADVFVTAHGCAGDVVRAADGAALARPTVITDLVRRQLQIEVPYRDFDPRGRTVRVGAAVGLWDEGKGEYLRPDSSLPAFFNVAFRKPGPWVQNTWMDASQNAALAAHDLSPLYAMVDFRKLAAHVDDDSDVPRTGPMNRIMVSRYETVQGRGNSYGGDIYGNYVCDPPACTYQYSGRLQPYSVYIPATAKPADGYGLVVNLHGANSNHNHFEGGSTEPPLSVWQMLAEQGNPSIMMMPNARGMTYCYYGMAGADVFEAWADLASHYRLDPRQALLTGSSMGGFGVYKFATAYPELFKAIFPNVGPEICSLTEPSAPVGAHTGQTGIGDAFASLRNVPVLATSGLDDPLVNIAITTRSASRLDLLGYRYDFWHFQSTVPPGGHAEYRQFVRTEYGSLNSSANAIDLNPRHVTYVLDGYVSDPRYGMRADHAYWVSGLQLADPTVSPPMGTIDVTSGAIPAVQQELLPIENASGVFYNGARAYKRQTRRWRPAGPERTSDAFAMTTTNLKTAELDVRRMRLPEFGTIDATIDADARLTLRLRGSFSAATSVTVNGRPQPTNADGTTLTVVLSSGTSHLRVAQSAPLAPTPCARRGVTVRVKAPLGDRLSVVRVYVKGKRTRTVRGRAATRAIRIAVPGAGARVTVRATTIKGRRLVWHRTYSGCR